jgi:hypothetical protein
VPTARHHKKLNRTPKAVVKDFSKPHPITDLDLAFGAAGRCVSDLLPAEKDIPEEFRRDSNPYVRAQRKWFFSGIDHRVFVPRPGIDKNLALRHLQAIQGSFEPQHQHKQAGVAYLMSLWFETPAV